MEIKKQKLTNPPVFYILLSFRLSVPSIYLVHDSRNVESLEI